MHACFLDIAKAFDQVDHSLLLHKLAGMRISGSELAWFRTYLCGRSICTTVGGVRSSRASISSGVPQGSVLGPLLFVVCSSDLPGVVQAKCALFADDTLVIQTALGQALCLAVSFSASWLKYKSGLTPGPQLSTLKSLHMCFLANVTWQMRHRRFS